MTSPDQQAGALSEEDLRALKSELLEGMKEYMREEDLPYDESDVLRCGQILDRFEAGVSRSSGRDEAVAHIHTAVLELNALNGECDGALIETFQREQICNFISHTTARRGFMSPDEDVTLEWRDW